MIQLLRDVISALVIRATDLVFNLLHPRPVAGIEQFTEAGLITLLLAVAASPDLSVDELDESLPALHELGAAAALCMSEARR